MSQQPNEDKKMDFSSLPRGAIGIKGLPVNRNTRLPSIRSPRDLTLGSQPKRTFMPNIPVRREKRATDSSKDLAQSADQNSSKPLKTSLSNDRGKNRDRGRGRGKEAIIQTTGSVFGEGFASDGLTRREKQRDSYYSPRASSSSSSGIVIKKESQEHDVSYLNRQLDNLLRDDFIDDGDEAEENIKPLIFPIEATLKKEEPKETDKDSTLTNSKHFDPDIAKSMNFDIEKVAKFIKKEKGVDEILTKPSSSEYADNDVCKVFQHSNSELVLLQFPQCITVPENSGDIDTDTTQNQGSQPISNEQKKNSASVSSLPEGNIGKLQLMKSGKTRLVIGSLKFELDSVTPLYSDHAIVSIYTNGNAGDLVFLGKMNQKLKFASDMDSLLS